MILPAADSSGNNQELRQNPMIVDTSRSTVLPYPGQIENDFQFQQRDS
jgi:hypothetical protein